METETKNRKTRTGQPLGPFPCPKCNHSHTGVKYTQIVPYGRYIRRRRVCHECGHDFVTFEVQAISYGKKNGHMPVLPILPPPVETDG